MARTKKCPPPGPSKAYLVSFGDTMTALLAFFIVLNSLAEEQTGANLHAGTGSFVQALKTFGVPGIFPSKMSSQPFQLPYPGPIYVVPPESEDEFTLQSTGPDDADDRQRIVDWEQEDFERFLHEISRWNEIKPETAIAGEVAIDLFAPLGRDDDTVPEELFSAARQLAPLLRKGGYELEVTVWATTPSVTAWSRAAGQAHDIREALAEYLRLGESASIAAKAKPWESSTSRRPTVSLIVRRLKH